MVTDLEGRGKDRLKGNESWLEKKKIRKYIGNIEGFLVSVLNGTRTNLLSGKESNLKKNAKSKKKIESIDFSAFPRYKYT